SWRGGRGDAGGRIGPRRRVPMLDDLDWRGLDGLAGQPPGQLPDGGPTRSEAGDPQHSGPEGRRGGSGRTRHRLPGRAMGRYGGGRGPNFRRPELGARAMAGHGARNERGEGFREARDQMVSTEGGEADPGSRGL